MSEGSKKVEQPAEKTKAAELSEKDAELLDKDLEQIAGGGTAPLTSYTGKLPGGAL